MRANGSRGEEDEPGGRVGGRRACRRPRRQRVRGEKREESELRRDEVLEEKEGDGGERVVPLFRSMNPAPAQVLKKAFQSIRAKLGMKI